MDYVCFKRKEDLTTEITSSETDVLVVAENNETRSCHKIILAKFSPFLWSLLDEDLEDCCIVMPDISIKHFEQVLSLAYSGLKDFLYYELVEGMSRN